MNWRAENAVTLLVFAAMTLGLYAMGAGYFSLMGLVVLLNMNTPRDTK